MATNYKTPGVYIQEPDSFPPSIVGVDTAVPAFIGYTEKANDTDNRSLHMIPRRISSLAEYQSLFGGGYPEKYFLSPTAGTKPDRDWGLVALGTDSFHLVEAGSSNFNLYDSMRLFYANGGGDCYICSCGLYTDGATPPVPTPITAKDMTDALDAVGAISGPTMLAIPDAMLLDPLATYEGVAVAMLQQCLEKGDRMALLDVWGTDAVVDGNFTTTITQFRDGLSSAPTESLRYGAVYFPSLVTSIVQASDVDITNFSWDDAHKTTLQTALGKIADASYPTDKAKAIKDAWITTIGTSHPNDTPTPDAGPRPLTHRSQTNALIANVPGFSKLLSAIAATQSVMPPSAAMAGVYTTNDIYNGVWNAPANTGIAGLIAPSLQISHKQQEDLNKPVNGLSINAIRSFQGRGNLVWGARTLDGLSNDWRYIQVRRTMIYVEQSVKDALQRQVFKPNTAQTWVTVTSMIESFLHGVWASGGLMGASPAEAYTVLCGMGVTMTPDDVLNGIMRVQITLQMVHPAEFIELTFKQEMLGGS